MTKEKLALWEESCEDISPLAVPVTVEEAKRLIRSEWKKEVAKDKSNDRLLVAYKTTFEALEGLEYTEKLIGWIRDNANSCDYIGELCDSLRVPLWWFEQF